MTVALYYSLKSGRLIPPVPFFFLHTNFRITLLISKKSTCWDSSWDCIGNPYRTGKTDILIKFICLIHECKLSLHSFNSPFISLSGYCSYPCIDHLHILLDLSLSVSFLWYTVLNFNLHLFPADV